MRGHRRIITNFRNIRSSASQSALNFPTNFDSILHLATTSACLTGAEMGLFAKSTKLCFRTFRNCQHTRKFTNIHYRIFNCVNEQFVAANHVHQCQKRMYSHHPPCPYPEIPSKEAAKSFVVHLDDRGRSLLLQELSRSHDESNKTSGKVKLYLF